MATVVQKYGGTSVGDPDRIRNVARRVLKTASGGHSVAVIVSAIGGETDQLVALAHELGGERPIAREFDVLLATGEQKTIASSTSNSRAMGRSPPSSWASATS